MINVDAICSGGKQGRRVTSAEKMRWSISTARSLQRKTSQYNNLCAYIALRRTKHLISSKQQQRSSVLEETPLAPTAAHDISQNFIWHQEKPNRICTLYNSAHGCSAEMKKKLLLFVVTFAFVNAAGAFISAF
jgi:hypothetical protein